MNIRNILVVGSIGLFGGLALWDYNSADSRRARDLRDMEKLAPDVQPPACYPSHPRAKVFAEAVYSDRRTQDTLPTEAIRRGALNHDCIRGADTRKNVDRLADILGDEGTPLYAAVLEKCLVDKLDVSASACFALDALAKTGTPAAVKALEKVVADRKQIKEVWLGALFRLLQVPAWKSRAELAAMVPAEKSWEAKELMVEKIREQRDPAARAALQQAFQAEQDPQEKGKLFAAVLEIDNPGRCVVEDQGEGAGGVCRYVCKDQNLRPRYPKVGKLCPPVREASAPSLETTAASVAGAAK